MMKKRKKTLRLTRLLWPFVLGLGLTLGLFCVLAFRLVIEARATTLHPIVTDKTVFVYSDAGDRAVSLAPPQFYNTDLQTFRMNVNYGHDWVDGDYEAGHTVWITVTEGYGGPIKATAELVTGIDTWDGESTGFSTNWQNWSPDQPDIAPGDWVYGLVDDGSTSTVRVGNISGVIDLDDDTISGSIHTDWFTQTLNASCGVWEDNGPGRDFAVDPDDGAYFCDFSSEWDLLPGQDVGVQYQEPDGDWVINVFREPVWAVRVNQSHNWIDGEAKPGSIVVATVWRDGTPVLSNATRNENYNWWNIGFCCGDESELRTGDIVEVQTSQGLTASIEVIPMTGSVDANAESISGQLFDIPSPAQVQGEVWSADGTSVNGLTDDAGNYTLDFRPFDVHPGYDVVLWYVQPDGHQVGIVRHALRLEVDIGRDRVEGQTTSHLPITATINGNETVTTTSDANGNFGLDFINDISLSDTIEAWAGEQHTSLVVVPVTANIEDADDKIWGYGPPNDYLGIGVDGDWRQISTDASGYYEVSYEGDISLNDDLEGQYTYPTGHGTRYHFGLSDVWVDTWTATGSAVPGDEYSYFVSYSNDAGNPATDVVITDTLPRFVTYLWDTSGVTPTVDADSNTLVWHLGTLGGYRSETFELRVSLDASLSQNTHLCNDVTISAPGDCNPDNNWSETDLWIDEPRVDLWVNHTLEIGLPIAGEVFTYQLNYGNEGNRTAYEVLLTDILPAGTTLVTTTFEAGTDGLNEYADTDVVSWDIGTLKPGESHQFELAVQVDERAIPGALLTNETTIGDDDGGDERNNKFQHTTVVEPLVADLWVNTEMDGDFSSAENGSVYRITYGNAGTLIAYDVILTDTLPVSMAHLWHSAGSVATMSNGTIVWQLGTVPPGASGQLLVGVQVNKTVINKESFANIVEASTSTRELYDDNNLVTMPGMPQAICMPWIGTRPHRVQSGLATTFKGTAKGYALETFAWDPGDGGPVITGAVNDPYIVEAHHTYNASPGTIFTATLTVWDTFGRSDTDTYTVKVFTSAHSVEAGIAVDEGLWYLHKQAQRDTSNGISFAEWGGGSVAGTASVIQAFQVQGHRPGGNPQEDPYVEDVQRGWNALFTHSKLDAIAPQPAGDPDSNGDGAGIGLYSNYGSAIYESGLAMMALASTGTPDRVASTGPSMYVRGQTYYNITQNMVDWFAWGQNDESSGTSRGGWRYQPNSGTSDNSNTQFPVLGMVASEDNWGIAAPGWVKDELCDYWLAYTQDSGGGFGYTGPGDWVNVSKAGAGIMDLIWTGVPVTDERIAKAIQFIITHWDDAPDGNWNGNLGEFYAMYAIKKGSQLADIHSYGSHLWDQEYASYLVRVQEPGGSFDDDGNMKGWQPMNTAWAVMILSPGLYRTLPTPITDSPILYGGLGAEWGNGKIQFDASASYHTDPDGEIIFFEWNFGDGSPVVTTTSALTTHTYLTRGIYLATLTLWDEAGNSASTATQVNITAPNNPPVANPGGAGDFAPKVVLYGANSEDPDEKISDNVTLYEWKIADGRLYTTTKPYLFFTWDISGTLPFTLRVRDRGVDYGLDSPKWSEPAMATVIINGKTPTVTPTHPPTPTAVATATSQPTVYPSIIKGNEYIAPFLAFILIVIIVVAVLFVLRSAKRA